MKPNIGGFERFARAFFGAVLLGVGIIAFSHIVAKAFFIFIGLYFLFEALSGICPLYKKFGATKPGQALSESNLYLLALLGIQVVLAYLWFHAGWEKVTGTFAAELPKTLQFFASQNPYPWYVSFLQKIVLPRATLFGMAVMWGQMLVGIALVDGAVKIAYGNAKWRGFGLCLSIIALLLGACMNWHFWLAAAWTGPGTAGSNVAMFWPQMILAYVWISRAMREKKG